MRSKKEQLIGGLVCAALLVAYALLIARPQTRALAGVRAEAQSLGTDIVARQILTQSTSLRETELQQCRGRIAGITEQVPSSDKLGDLIAQLSEASEAWNLRSTDVAPANGYEIGKLRVLPIEVTFECDFPSLFGFVQRIETLPRLVRVSRLKTQRRADAPAVLTCELTLQVFSELP